MGYALRLYEPGRVYEITSRTLQGRFFLRPGAKVNDLIIGVIGHAQKLYPEVHVHLVVILSNHSTWLVSTDHPEKIAAFMGFINGRLSQELGRLYDWPGKMWERPARPIPVLDDAALRDRVKYLLSNSCKEGLVASPMDWPGVTCVRALCNGEAMVGTWHWRDAERRARRAGRPKEVTERCEVKLERLPGYEEMTDEEYREFIRGVVREIEEEVAQERKAAGKGAPLGVEKVCAMDPCHRPAKVARSPAPLCHGSTRTVREAFRAKYRAFVKAYRKAAAKLKAGVLDAEFPLYSYPPGRPMVLPAAA